LFNTDSEGSIGTANIADRGIAPEFTPKSYIFGAFAPTRVGDIEVESSGTPVLPIILKLSVEMTAAEGNDCVGPSDCPEHPGLLEAGADYGFRSSFDDAGADNILKTKKRAAARPPLSRPAILLRPALAPNGSPMAVKDHGEIYPQRSIKRRC
jgi:hypothetical protein